MRWVALQVTIGPYTVDFAQPLSSEELAALQQEKRRNPRGRLRPHDADWCCVSLNSPLLFK